nr:hypothetical protein [Tanacetum cinerariifolium]
MSPIGCTIDFGEGFSVLRFGASCVHGISSASEVRLNGRKDIQKNTMDLLKIRSLPNGLRNSTQNHREGCTSSKDAATAVNKDAATDSMLSNQFVQHPLHMPSLVTHDSSDLLELERVLEMTIDSRDTTEPIATIGVTPKWETSGSTRSGSRRGKRRAADSLFLDLAHFTSKNALLDHFLNCPPTLNDCEEVFPVMYYQKDALNVYSSHNSDHVVANEGPSTEKVEYFLETKAFLFPLAGAEECVGSFMMTPFNVFSFIVEQDFKKDLMVLGLDTGKLNPSASDGQGLSTLEIDTLESLAGYFTKTKSL